jgi:hypothetical protein
MLVFLVYVGVGKLILNLGAKVLVRVLPLGALPECFEPAVTGLDIKPDKPAAKYEGREES